ncbi:hypothetical protein KQX54_018668 [Cotesia glomerata]|uniref:Uncharacterized protein n=1 Tax=Cotesia glomerata TaxID=32391 RepID=A0AAV7IAQ7_COTGL|nr:hypothetical protein KQX54_018668 [Cotesia glomerata]
MVKAKGGGGRFIGNYIQLILSRQSRELRVGYGTSRGPTTTTTTTNTTISPGRSKGASEEPDTEEDGVIIQWVGSFKGKEAQLREKRVELAVGSRELQRVHNYVRMRTHMLYISGDVIFTPAWGWAPVAIGIRLIMILIPVISVCRPLYPLCRILDAGGVAVPMPSAFVISPEAMPSTSRPHMYLIL